MARLNFEIPDDLYSRLQAHIPWGMRSNLYRTVTEIIADVASCTGLEVVMILDDLKESISGMSNERLMAFVAQVRASRKTEKEVAPPSKGKDKRPTKAKETRADKIEALLGGMKQEQIDALAASLKDDPSVIALLKKELGDAKPE